MSTGRTRRTAASVVLTVLSSLPAFSVSPPGGDLDWTFGRAGRVTTDLSDVFEEAQAVAIQRDGKIIAAGAAFFRRSGTSFVLVRYFPDGSLDRAFGDKGVVKTNFTGGSDVARDIALQGDGKIVAAGFTAFGEDFAVARYLEDGTLDRSFGRGGKVVVDFNGQTDMGYAIASQEDGKILVGGYAGLGSNKFGFALVRLHENGDLDESFGDGGRVISGFEGDFAFLYDLTLQPDGRIIAAGEASRMLALARYNEDGGLDESFGNGGLVTAELVGDAAASGVGLQPDGRIVVGGSVRLEPGETDFVLARYDRQGSLDVTFGTEGIVQTSVGTEEHITALVTEPDGSILVAGLAALTAFDQSSQQFALVRYAPDGSLDRNFGRRGVVLTDFANRQDRANDLALGVDGGVVVVGGAESPSGDFDFALARYRHDPIFSDGFESGDTLAWDQVKRRVEVVRPGLRGTGHALAVTVDGLGRKSFVRSRHPLREDTLRIAFQLLVNEVDLGGAEIEILRASGGRKVFQLFLENDGGVYFVSLRAWEDSGSVRPVGRVKVPRRHGVRLAVEWCGASGKGVRDGVARLLKRRGVKAEATNLDNGGLRVSDMKVGLPAGSRGGLGSFLIDEYASIR